ncbi:MAG: hypothetical protein ACPK7O_02435 [Methanobacterium sp.]
MGNEDRNMELIIEEYKMSMGGYFNKTLEKGHEDELELLAIENAIENHLFDTHQLLSIYDELSDSNKREFFRKVIVGFIEFKFDKNNNE